MWSLPKGHGNSVSNLLRKIAVSPLRAMKAIHISLLVFNCWMNGFQGWLQKTSKSVPNSIILKDQVLATNYERLGTTRVAIE